MHLPQNHVSYLRGPINSALDPLRQCPIGPTPPTVGCTSKIAVLITRTTQVPFDLAASAALRGVNDSGIDAKRIIRPAFPAGRKFGALANHQGTAGRTSRGVVEALTYVNGQSVDQSRMITEKRRSETWAANLDSVTEPRPPPNAIAVFFA